MDHVDWLDQKTVEELAATLAQQVLPGGIVIWRSASLTPPYSKVRKKAAHRLSQLAQLSSMCCAGAAVSLSGIIEGLGTLSAVLTMCAVRLWVFAGDC